MRLAVIIPTYNRADMVQAAVASALEQTRPADVVVVDDGSTDGTAEVLRKRFGDEIRLVVQENAERGAARNNGASHVPEADALCFLDADDVLLPGHVDALMAAWAEMPEATLVCTRARHADEALKPAELLVRQPPGPLRLRSFLGGRVVLPQGATALRASLFRALGGFDEDRALSGSEDWLLVARALAAGVGIQVDAETVVIRKHEGNTMANARSMQRSMLRAHELLFGTYASEVAEGPGAADLPDDARERSKARLLVQSAATFRGVGEMAEARARLREAWSASPWQTLLDSRTWRIWLRSWLG